MKDIGDRSDSRAVGHVAIAPVVPASCEIVTISREDASAGIEQMAAVVRKAAILLPLPELKDDPRRVITDHSRAIGFTCVGARPGSRPGLIAFAYGWSVKIDSPWSAQVADALDPAGRRRWLSDAFRLAALVITDEFRRCGDARVLQDTLLALTSHRAALLATPENHPVTALCRSAGWVVLGDVPASSQQRVILMGRRLPLP